jgi:Bardet-Biedl syndrome 9 protein
MGGDLMFWEQDAFSFKTQLPDALLPGPLCFASSNDTIVTCTTSGTVEAYKYIALAAQSDTTKAKAVWTLNIAEHALDIQFAPTTPATIVVLGARSVFWLTDSGGLRLSKRLESDPMCMLCYRVDGASMNMLVGTIDRQLIVLRDTQVVWSALLDFIPVAVSLCEFGGTRGVIVALEDTDPEVATRIVPDAQDVAYERMDEEMAELQGQIRAVLLAETKAPTAAVLELECSHPEIQTREDGSWALASKVRLACADGDRIDGVSFQVITASLRVPPVSHPLQGCAAVPGLRAVSPSLQPACALLQTTQMEMHCGSNLTPRCTRCR